MKNLVLITFVMLLCHAAFAADVGTPWKITDGLTTLVSWEEVGGGGVVRALTVVRWSDDREVRRTLFETPQGDRVVLTREYFPTRGISRVGLQDDSSKWAAT